MSDKLINQKNNENNYLTKKEEEIENEKNGYINQKEEIEKIKTNDEEKTKNENGQNLLNGKDNKKSNKNEETNETMETSIQNESCCQKNEEKEININLIKLFHSIHIMKKLFENLNKKRKFIMIRYNKELQNKLGINIHDYKKISGKYKIDGTNGFGKE